MALLPPEEVILEEIMELTKHWPSGGYAASWTNWNRFGQLDDLHNCRCQTLGNRFHSILPEFDLTTAFTQCWAYYSFHHSILARNMVNLLAALTLQPTMEQRCILFTSHMRCMHTIAMRRCCGVRELPYCTETS